MRRTFIFLLLISAWMIQGCRVILETPAPEVVTPPTASEVVATDIAATSPPPTATPALVAQSSPTPPPEAAYPLAETPQSLSAPTAQVGEQNLMLLSTPLPTPTPTPAMRLVLQDSTPVYARAFRYEALGCNWMGVAGQAFDRDGRPITGLVVRVVGNVAGQNLDASGLTGLVTDYGPAGYEVKLADRVAPAIFWIQVFDVQGTPVSEAFMVQMSGADCTRNLAIINFVVDASAAYNQRLYLPLVGR